MRLITTDAILRKYIPNVLSTVTGEQSLFEKLTPFLELAEEWVKDTFTSEQTFNTIAGYTDTNVIKTFTCKVVVCHAFMVAVPSLDLVLTPNGFGIVSNANVAPASKERVERLIDSLETERDRAIRLLLSSLIGASKWTSSSQYLYFSASLFPNLDICDYVGVGEHLWQKYLELRPILFDVEVSIEAHFLGKEQMDALRKKIIESSSSTSTVVRSVISSLRAEVAQRVNSSHSAPFCSPPTALINIVDVIRNTPAEFPEWHSSPIKNLFDAPSFVNKKNSRGYWF